MPIAVIITSESHIAHIIYWEMFFIHGQYQALMVKPDFFLEPELELLAPSWFFGAGAEAFGSKQCFRSWSWSFWLQ